MKKIKRSLGWTGRTTVRATWGATKYSAKGVGLALKGTYRYRREIGSATVATGIAFAHSAGSLSRSVYDLYSNLGYSDRYLERQRLEIEEQGRQYARWVDQLRSLPTLDAIAVGGDVLRTYAIGADPPAQIAEAYRLAYPNETAAMTFSEKVRSLDEAQLAGFTAGVKGKLFELQYVDRLNQGQLPDGYTAELAGSATQPGWDIAITGPDGEIAQALQAKATESVSYVADAIGEYPQIDVVTTDEVYSHLALQETAESVTSAGVANADLSAEVGETLREAGYSVGDGIPIISLALIAFTTYTLEEASAQQKARIAGSRVGSSYLSFLAAQGVLVVTQTWWMGVLGGCGFQYALHRGARHRDQGKTLARVKRINRRVMNRMRRQYEAGASRA